MEEDLFVKREGEREGMVQTMSRQVSDTRRLSDQPDTGAKEGLSSCIQVISSRYRRRQIILPEPSHQHQLYIQSRGVRTPPLPIDFTKIPLTFGSSSYRVCEYYQVYLEE